MCFMTGERTNKYFLKQIAGSSLLLNDEVFKLRFRGREIRQKRFPDHDVLSIGQRKDCQGPGGDLKFLVF